MSKRGELHRQADVLARMYLKARSDFHAAAREVTQYVAEHQRAPDWTRERFDEIKTRMASIMDAMRSLRAQLEDPLYGIEIPSHWPPTGHEDA